MEPMLAIKIPFPYLISTVRNGRSRPSSVASNICKYLCAKKARSIDVNPKWNRKSDGRVYLDRKPSQLTPSW